MLSRPYWARAFWRTQICLSLAWALGQATSGCGSKGHKIALDAGSMTAEADDQLDGSFDDDDDDRDDDDDDDRDDDDDDDRDDDAETSDDAQVGPDAGAAGREAGAASGSDASLTDAGLPTTGNDATTSVGDASGPDGSAPDARVERDAAATPGDDEPGSVRCATSAGDAATCDLSAQICCSGQGCAAKATGCASGVSIGCDGPEDCVGGQVCCGGLAALQCAATCSTVAVCHDNADCASGEACFGVSAAQLGLCVPSFPDAGFGGRDGGFGFPGFDGGFSFPGFDGGFPFPRFDGG